MHVRERPKINEKEAREGPFKKDQAKNKQYDN